MLRDNWSQECLVVFSRETVESLSEYSYPEYLTRETKALNDANCDIAVSIHTDASRSATARGVTCFKGGNLSAPIGQALLDAFAAAALLPLRRTEPIYHYKDRGPGYPLYLHILRETNMPTVLIECGFHDSAEDMKVIGTPEGRKAVGEVLAQGIAAYYGWPAPAEGAIVPNEGTDVSSWAQEAVDWVQQNALMTVFADGTFRGQEPVTRQQQAVTLKRFKDYMWNLFYERVD